MGLITKQLASGLESAILSVDNALDASSLERFCDALCSQARDSFFDASQFIVQVSDQELNAITTQLLAASDSLEKSIDRVGGLSLDLTERLTGYASSCRMRASGLRDLRQSVAYRMPRRS